MEYENPPIAAPKLLKANSTVETCASCGMWVERYPDFLDSEGFWQCEKCGCTSVKQRPGRPYGPKSKEWHWINERFNDLFIYFAPGDFDAVETDPPMQSLDWKAVKAWNRRRAG